MQFLYVLPYAAVVGLAIWGLNVMLVLTVGIAITGLIGILAGKFDFWTYLSNLGDGVTSMGDLIIVAMLAGGMLELIRANGGLRLIICLLQKGIRGRRGLRWRLPLLSRSLMSVPLTTRWP